MCQPWLSIFVLQPLGEIILIVCDYATPNSAAPTFSPTYHACPVTEILPRNGFEVGSWYVQFWCLYQSRLERDDEGNIVICVDFSGVLCFNQDPFTKTITGFLFVLAQCHLMILDAIPQKSIAFCMADSTPPSLCSAPSSHDKTAELVYFKSDSDCTWLLHPSSSLAHLHFY